MQRSWNLLFQLEIAAAISLLLSVGMDWHRDYGTGVEVIQYAFSPEAAMFIFSSGSVQITLSAWMLIATLPLLGIFWGLRAALAYMTGGVKQDNFVRLGIVYMLIVPLWFWQANAEKMMAGFGICFVSTVLLCAAVALEFSLPVETRRRKTLEDLLFEERPSENELSECPSCGGLNVPFARTCIHCNSVLIRE